MTECTYRAYGMSFGIGLGQMAGKVFRIGHLGSLTDILVLAGIAKFELAMKNLNHPIELGTGISAEQEY